MPLLWSVYIFKYVYIWCNIFQMQPDGRYKNSLLGKYSIFIFTLYSQYIICESQHFLVFLGRHFTYQLNSPHASSAPSHGLLVSSMYPTLFHISLKMSGKARQLKEIHATKSWKDWYCHHRAQPWPGKIEISEK